MEIVDTNSVDLTDKENE